MLDPKENLTGNSFLTYLLLWRSLVFMSKPNSTADGCKCSSVFGGELNYMISLRSVSTAFTTRIRHSCYLSTVL